MLVVVCVRVLVRMLCFSRVCLCLCSLRRSVVWCCVVCLRCCAVCAPLAHGFLLCRRQAPLSSGVLPLGASCSSPAQDLEVRSHPTSVPPANADVARGCADVSIRYPAQAEAPAATAAAALADEAEAQRVRALAPLGIELPTLAALVPRAPRHACPKHKHHITATHTPIYIAYTHCILQIHSPNTYFTHT